MRVNILVSVILENIYAVSKKDSTKQQFKVKVITKVCIKTMNSRLRYGCECDCSSGVLFQEKFPTHPTNKEVSINLVNIE